MAKYAPRTSTAAVAKAKSWVGKSYPAGWCQRWVVAEIFGTGGVGDFDGDRAADAEDGWKAALKNGRVVQAAQIKDYDDIPAGVALYWTGGSRDNGHAAVSAGNGETYSTDLPTMGKVGKVKITEVARRWGMLFLGYVTVTGNGYTLTDKPSGPVDKMDPANYGPGKVGDHITWLGQRLVAHGFGKHYKTGPGPTWGEADRLNVRDFQVAQGWRGGDADGLPGRESLRRLATEPAKATGIDLTRWKLTLPVGEDGHPDEVFPIAKFQDPPWFVRNSDGSLRFRAHCGGTTTSGSKYPRCELREMSGSKLAAWSSRSGVHNMTYTAAITHLPVKKPHVVAGQIHSGSDDVVMVRLEGRRLFVEADGDDVGLLDAAYVLGTKFTVTIRADKAGIAISYNGRRPIVVKETGSGWYFKGPGVYTQSNTSKGDKASAYGEVVTYALTVTHTN